MLPNAEVKIEKCPVNDNKGIIDNLHVIAGGVSTIVAGRKFINEIPIEELTEKASNFYCDSKNGVEKMPGFTGNKLKNEIDSYIVSMKQKSEEIKLTKENCQELIIIIKSCMENIGIVNDKIKLLVSKIVKAFNNEINNFEQDYKFKNMKLEKIKELILLAIKQSEKIK